VTARRELLLVVALTLVGAALVLLSTGRPWAHAVVAVLGSPQAPQSVNLSGRSVAPLVAALGVVALAAVVALLATRGRWRIVVGALLAVVGALIVGSIALTTAHDIRSGSALRDHVSTAALHDARISVELRSWRHVAAVGGLLVVAAGLLAAARGRSWVAMGARFEQRVPSDEKPAPQPVPPAPAPQAAPAVDDGSSLDLWDRLDRGEDPTG
jgi:uncharacterized membrane protein (TIGR02234 family)